MNGYPSWFSSPTTQRRSPSRVRIVTDSASDILPSHAQAIGVFVVPNRIIMEGYALRDGIDISAAQFYARLPKMRVPPYTEPATSADFYQAYRTAFRLGASAIVSIHVSGGFSRVVNHAEAARDYLGSAPIDVIDSQQIGIGMWPAVIEAARLAHLGAGIQDVHERVTSLLARTHIFVLVESLEPLRRSGRIGRIQGLVGTLLDAHPILRFDQGEARLAETVRSRRRAALRLGELVRELTRSAGGAEMLLMCGTSIESIAEMETILIDQQAAVIRKTWLGPTIGANLGSAVAVAVVLPR
jgi:fatty acid kinase fatty acid binding subunit